MEQSSFGKWLKAKRKGLDLTRDEFAKRTGYSVATIRKVEDNERRPSEQFVEQLAGVLNISQSERESFLRFARGDRKFTPTENVEGGPWNTSHKTPRSNIPATTTSLIARETEIALVREYLSKDDIRLVTLMGPPGIGKTRLSIETARASLPDFPDGVFFVPLATTENPDLISSAIIQVLGYLEDGEVSAEKQLMIGIGEKQMLVVLDNCEHLIDKVAAIGSNLLSACSSLKILATSRESFRIPGEWLYHVPAFDLPEENESINLDDASTFPALMLFVERARAVRPDFKLTSENIQTVAAICAHLDGLPLVIELIAARMRLMSPQALLERMSGQFVLTADGMRAPSERQKTLQHAIDWSYNLLSSEEQRLFVYLSVFSGGFALADVEAIFENDFTEKSVPELLTSLLDKSLIRPVNKESVDDHYEMLVTIREYALRRLIELGEETEIRNRHMAYFLELAEIANNELYGHYQLEWLARLRLTRNSLRAALAWAVETKQTEFALRMTLNLYWFRHICSDHVEAAHSIINVLGLPNVSSRPKLHAEVLTQLQHHIHLLGDSFAVQIGDSEMARYAQQALSIAKAHQDPHNSARALAMIGLTLINRKNFIEAQSVLEESGSLYQQCQDEWGYSYIRFLIGWSAFVQNDLVTALPIMEEAHAGFKKLGERYFMCVALRYIGAAHMRQGKPKIGLEKLKESLLLARQLEAKYEIAAAFYRLGQVAQYLGNPVRTVVLFWAAKTAYDTINSGMWTQGMDADFEDVLQRCRSSLGEVGYNKALENGRKMTMEGAITYALEDNVG